MKGHFSKCSRRTTDAFHPYHVAAPEQETELRRKILSKLAAATTPAGGVPGKGLDYRSSDPHEQPRGNAGGGR